MYTHTNIYKHGCIKYLYIYMHERMYKENQIDLNHKLVTALILHIILDNLQVNKF